MARATYEGSTDEIFTTAVEDLEYLIGDALTGRDAIKAIEKMFKQEGLKGLKASSWGRGVAGGNPRRGITVHLPEGGEIEFEFELRIREAS